MPGREMNPSTKPAPESPVSLSAAAELDAVYGKIAGRIIPFLVLLFLMAWLDRYNLGFAKLQMVKDLGFSEAVYGFGAGIVYLGYALFEVPSNLLLERMLAAQDLRANYDPMGHHQCGHDVSEDSGVVLRPSLPARLVRSRSLSWSSRLSDLFFPRPPRARMLAGFATSFPVSIILGSPISAWIMESMGGRAGLANWQWLFVLEGMPSILMGVLALAVVVDKPAQPVGGPKASGGAF
jgi:sugar phosphate permease